MHASAWFDGNDMRVRLDQLQSSTMSASSYVNSSTGVRCRVWGARTTGSTADVAVATQNMPYTTGSNGRYDLTIQSTDHTMSAGTIGFCEITVSHNGLTGAWRPEFRVEQRRST